MPFVGKVDISVLTFLLNIGLIRVVVDRIIGIMDFFKGYYPFIFGKVAVIVIETNLCFSVVHFVGFGEAEAFDEVVGL